MGMVARLDVKRLDGLIAELERLALRREKLIAERDPAAARRLRAMLHEATTARASLLAGGLLARAGMNDVIARAEALIDESESSEVRPLARLTGVAISEDSGPVHLAKMLGVDVSRIEEPVGDPVSHASRFETDETPTPVRLRREDTPWPFPVADDSAPDAPRLGPSSGPGVVLARVAVVPRMAPRPRLRARPSPPGPWTSLPQAVTERMFPAVRPPETDDD